MADKPDPPRRFLQSLNWSLDVLERIAAADQPLGITEIAGILDLSKGAVHTVVTNLEVRGYVRRAPGSLAFVLGRTTWQLGLQAGRSFGLADLVDDDLQLLADVTGETSQIMSYVSPGEILFLHRVVSHHPVQAAVPIGARAPASTTSSGLVLLAHQPEAEIQRVLDRPLPKVTANSVDDPALLSKALEKVRQDGYTVNLGTHYEDTVTMSAPVRDHTGAVAYAVGVYGPEYRFTVKLAHAAAPRLIGVAQAISEKLGYRVGARKSRVPKRNVS